MRRVRAPKKAVGEPSWKWRRLMTFAVMLFAGWQLHRLTSMPDTRVNETIAWGWQVLMSVLALGYTGFATAQDIAAIWTTRSAQPYQEPPPDGWPTDIARPPDEPPPEGRD